jgi:hypothetical protein
MSPGATDQQIPGPLLLQAAFADLAVVRSNQGISPAVKLQLRQAAHDLRDATADASRWSSVEKAATILRSSLEMIQNRETIESDQRLLAGLVSVLGYLSRFLGVPPAPIVDRDTHEGWAVPLGAPPVAVTAVLPGMSAEVPQALSENPRPTLSLQLAQIERQYVARAACLDQPSSTFGDLQGIERHIRELEATARELLPAEAGVPGFDATLSNVGAWWFWGQTGQLVAGNPVLATAAARLAAAPAEEHRIALDIVRMNPSHASTTDIWAAARGPVLTALRARCLPLFFERNLPDGEALLRMLDEPAMAMAAASALAWCRIPDGSQRLLRKARDCSQPELSNALLFASVTQGDRAPISEVRMRLARGSDSPWLIDALAVAGEEADAGLLCDVALSSEVVAEYALWAVAHLGASSVLERMKDLECRLKPMLVARAIELVADSMDLDALPSGRYVDGEPWAVTVMARRLAAPAELPLPILRWTALDLAVRTGEPAPCVYDVTASTEQQEATGQAFAARFSAKFALDQGGWCYFARPVGVAV